MNEWRLYPLWSFLLFTAPIPLFALLSRHTAGGGTWSDFLLFLAMFAASNASFLVLQFAVAHYVEQEKANTASVESALLWALFPMVALCIVGYSIAILMFQLDTDGFASGLLLMTILALNFVLLPILSVAGWFFGRLRTPRPVSPDEEPSAWRLKRRRHL